MQDMDALLPKILRYAPDCSDPLAVTCIREAARRACEAGKFWRVTDTIIVSSPEAEGVCSYDEVSIVRIEAAEMDGQKLEPVSIADLDNRNPLWQSDYTDQTQPRYITQLNPNTITLYPKVAGTVTARLVLKPSINAFTLPEFLIEQYGEQIGKGAAAGVLMTPDPKVQNFEVGAMLAMEFQSWLDGLNVKAAKGQQNARLRTKGSYF